MNFFESESFLDPTDPRLTPYKNTKQQDPRWDTTPVGKCFFVPASDADINQNKKRPSIPARCQGRFRTKAYKLEGRSGYLVTRLR
tara:strand:- start:88 stop:342 length:255 start_codon:yes stop_codon:yes gene_type:complete